MSTVHAVDVAQALYLTAVWLVETPRADALKEAGVKLHFPFSPPTSSPFSLGALKRSSSFSQEWKSIKTVVPEDEEVVAPMFNAVDDGASTQDSIARAVADVWGIKYGFLNTAMAALVQQFSKSDFNDMVEDVNEKVGGSVFLVSWHCFCSAAVLLVSQRCFYCTGRLFVVYGMRPHSEMPARPLLVSVLGLARRKEIAPAGPSAAAYKYPGGCSFPSASLYHAQCEAGQHTTQSLYRYRSRSDTQHIGAWSEMLAKSNPPIDSTPLTPFLEAHAFRSRSQMGCSQRNPRYWNPGTRR